MAGEFSVSTHTTFFAGYLDAVGRQYSDDKRLCAITAAMRPADLFESISVERAEPVKNMLREFERDIARFLSADPRTRIVFYLTEYFDWYKQFSGSCVCEKVHLTGSDLPTDHIGYRLFIDHAHEVLFVGYWKDKGAMPDTSLERTRER
jgi:hypothetical protein